MRVLATVALSFSAAIFTATLLPVFGWELWAAGALSCLAILTAILRKPLARRKQKLPRRLLLIFCAAAVGLLYSTAYDYFVCRPVTALCGKAENFSGTVCQYPLPTDNGGKVTLRLKGGHGAKAVYYADESVLDLKPGQEITGYAYWQNASLIHGKSIKTFTSKGVYALLYERGSVSISADHSDRIRYWPLRALEAVQRQVEKIWTDPQTRGFTMAELSGDESQMDAGDSEMLSEMGLAHLFAVSGLHCAFLVTLLGLLIPRNRRGLLAAIAGMILLFYMVMVGASPSVVRACIMQLFLLAAPVFRRDSDGLTSLSAALMVLLLVNPYASGSVSLQLSFAATFGLVCLSDKIYRFLTEWYKGKKKSIKIVLAFAAANISSSLAVLVFSVPLIFYYFDIFTPVSPISNLLAVPVAGWNFIAGFITVLLSFICLPAAKIMGWFCFGCVHYILWVCELLMRLPWHTLYSSNHLLKYWMAYCYAMFIGCAFTKDRRRKYVVATVLAVLTLFCTVNLNLRQYHYAEMCAVAVDVGQGESVLLYSNGKAALVDCGSSNTYVDAGREALAQMSAMGVRSLDTIVVTHYHADHTNGLFQILRAIPVQTIYLPDIEDEYGVKESIITLAEEQGIAVEYVADMLTTPLGNATVTIYPPVGKGDLNEQGLSALCKAGDFEILITGDMAGTTEKALVAAYDLPKVEVLMVSHHGSKNSSKRDFLQAIQPQTAIISVGDNNYGHPSDAALARLYGSGAKVYRTDTGGNILVTVNKAD